MSARSIEELQHYLERLCDEAVSPDDAVLLDRLVATRDREAFALLIARHGPMVLGTARRLAASTNDAEDVFQAVFLSLGRLAKSIRQKRALPAWLHQATCRIAAKVRKERGVDSREPSPEPCEQIDPAARLVWQEVRQALDEELQRLPERLRSPLLLCYLSGLTRDEAARQLGWSLGTLKRRLDAGRTILRGRLSRRGIGSVGLALTVLTPEALQAAVSTTLLDSSLRLIFAPRSDVPVSIAALALRSATSTKGLAMKSILALGVALAIGFGIYATTGPGDPPKKEEDSKAVVKRASEEKDAAAADPLPAGSMLRFGTSRYRHGESISYMAVSADGKIAVVGAGTLLTGHGSTRAFDPTSGRALFYLSGATDALAISRDGRKIVTKAVLRQPVLQVFDSETGKVLHSIDRRGGSHLPEGNALAFAADGKAIATSFNGNDVELIDIETGNTIRTYLHHNPESALSGPYPQALAIAFSPDGKWMATGGYANVKNDYFVRLWDVETGKEVRFMHGKGGSSGVRSLAFSPDSKTLAIDSVHSGGYLRLFDVATGKLRHTLPKGGTASTRPGSVAFAPDGKSVVVASATIRVYDVESGEERLNIHQQAIGPRFIDGGKTLVAAVAGTIYRWDAATGKLLTAEGGDSGIEQIFVTPDGSRVITRDSNGNGHLWNARNGKYLRRFSAAYQRGVAMSPDGRFLACPVADSSVSLAAGGMHGPYGSRISLYDLAANKYLNPFPAFKGEAQDVAYTPDGKKLVTTEGSGGRVRIWDVATSKEERSFNILPDGLMKQPCFVRHSFLSPDGKTVVVTYEEDRSNRAMMGGLMAPARQLVRLWDVTTGKQLPEFSHGNPVGKAFSPNGRFVVTYGGNLCHVATGKRVATLPNGSSVGGARFSHDGRFLATAISGGILQIWEVATWTMRNEFKGGHRDGLSTLDFAPDGRLLSGSPDTTVVAWNTQPPRVADSVTLESAWNSLAAKEVSESYRSEGKFQAAPADTVEYFAEKVQPGKALDVKQVERWLADLDSDPFAAREAASTALEGLGRPAIPYLESTLNKTESAEVRVRATRILEKLLGAALPPEQMRQVRAVMILERIGNGESKNLLKQWAAGPAGALLTMEATDALKRLEAMPNTER